MSPKATLRVTSRANDDETYLVRFEFVDDADKVVGIATATVDLVAGNAATVDAAALVSRPAVDIHVVQVARFPFGSLGQ